MGHGASQVSRKCVLKTFHSRTSKLPVWPSLHLLEGSQWPLEQANHPGIFLFPLALKLRWFQVPDFSGNWILWVNFCPQLPFQMLIGKQFDWFAPSFRAWRKASLSGGGVFLTVPPLGMVSFGWVGGWRGTVHRSSPAALCTALLVKRCGSRRQRYQCCRAPPNCFGAEKLVWSREAGSVTGPAMLSEGGYCFVTGIALPGLWL